MLWIEKASDELVKSLDKEELELQEAIFEIITSENAYVSSLEFWCQVLIFLKCRMCEESSIPS